ncbi:MAG: ABC transporter ATP-binding protein [Actinomycetes bacterium]
MSAEPVLSVRDLRVRFHTPAGEVAAVDGVSFDVLGNEVLAVIGESGSGKSVTAMSILGLLPEPPAEVTDGTIEWKGDDLLRADDARMRQVRGAEIAMIFQDPLTALNPVHTVGRQIGEMVRTHRGMSRAEARQHAIEMLRLVGIPQAETRVDSYPHEFSGGMRQRVMIAMAIACSPKLLIADEPTTALDVTVQAQVLEVISAIKDEIGSAVMLITHDLGVVAGLADRVLVMYAGREVEQGTVDEIFYGTAHPYTLGLMSSLPRLDDVDGEPLRPIPGAPPSLLRVPPGCAFHPRCEFAVPGRCDTDDPVVRPVAGTHASACLRVDEVPELGAPK